MLYVDDHKHALHTDKKQQISSNVAVVNKHKLGSVQNLVVLNTARLQNCNGLLLHTLSHKSKQIDTLLIITKYQS